MLDMFVPYYNYSDVKFASSFYINLLVDNICIGQSLNPINCYYVRFSHDGTFLDVDRKNIFSGSALTINPSIQDSDDYEVIGDTLH